MCAATWFCYHACVYSNRVWLGGPNLDPVIVHGWLVVSRCAAMQALAADWTCEQRVAVGKWAMISDELSIWRRKRRVRTTAASDDSAGAGAAAGDKGQEQERRASEYPRGWHFCANCHLDLPARGTAPPPLFCTAECEELYQPRRSVGGGSSASRSGLPLAQPKGKDTPHNYAAAATTGTKRLFDAAISGGGGSTAAPVAAFTFGFSGS
eukprot:COSAG06_NODE_379_length_16608_cov_83.792477_13_plen_209_part_00